MVKLVYLVLYKSMADWDQPSEVTRFSALTQSAMLHTFALVSILVVVRALAEGAVGRWLQDLNLQLVGITLLVFFFLLVRQLTADVEPEIQTSELRPADPRVRLAKAYPYLVIGMFVLSVILVIAS